MDRELSPEELEAIVDIDLIQDYILAVDSIWRVAREQPSYDPDLQHALYRLIHLLDKDLVEAKSLLISRDILFQVREQNDK